LYLLKFWLWRKELKLIAKNKVRRVNIKLFILKNL